MHGFLLGQQMLEAPDSALISILKWGVHAVLVVLQLLKEEVNWRQIFHHSLNLAP